MVEIIIDALIDSIKLLPFLFLVYLIMEFLEHKSNSKTEKIIRKSGKFGPAIGGVLGAFPQCGFSVMASNLYTIKLISAGTLIAICLSTSDEMLPILLSYGVGASKILKFIVIKVLIAIFSGLLVDLFITKKSKKVKMEISKICDDEHCHCDENIFLSSIKHSINIFIFILLANLIMNCLIYVIGEDKITSFLVGNNFITPIILGLIGLIPNCAPSVIITELYLNSSLTFGSALSGLLASSGLGILILFKLNKNIRENIKILTFIYLVSVVVGIIFNILKITI